MRTWRFLLVRPTFNIILNDPSFGQTIVALPLTPLHVQTYFRRTRPELKCLVWRVNGDLKWSCTDFKTPPGRRIAAIKSRYEFSSKQLPHRGEEGLIRYLPRKFESSHGRAYNNVFGDESRVVQSN